MKATPKVRKGLIACEAFLFYGTRQKLINKPISCAAGCNSMEINQLEHESCERKIKS